MEQASIFRRPRTKAKLAARAAADKAYNDSFSYEEEKKKAQALVQQAEPVEEEDAAAPTAATKQASAAHSKGDRRR